MPSTCCPTYASTRLLLTGAVLYRRVSRPCKSSTSDHGAAALTCHGANLVHSLLHLPHQPPVPPSPKGRHEYGDYCTTDREERPDLLPSSGVTQRGTTPLCHLPEALRCPQ